MFPAEKRIVDIELHYLLLCFSLDDILKLISCVLTQQRLVFMSSKYAMLTLIIEVCIVNLCANLSSVYYNYFNYITVQSLSVKSVRGEGGVG